MAVPTTQELLDKVNEAIGNKMDGRAVLSYTIGGKNIQFESLKSLKEMRTQLMGEVNSGRSTRNYAGFRRPC